MLLAAQQEGLIPLARRQFWDLDSFDLSTQLEACVALHALHVVGSGLPKSHVQGAGLLLEVMGHPRSGTLARQLQLQPRFTNAPNGSMKKLHLQTNMAF